MCQAETDGEMWAWTYVFLIGRPDHDPDWIGPNFIFLDPGGIGW